MKVVSIKFKILYTFFFELSEINETFRVKYFTFFPTPKEIIACVGRAMMPIQRPAGSFVAEYRRELTKKRQRKAIYEDS